MFQPETNLMFYVDDVAKEKTFWQAIGFEISEIAEMMGFLSFEMKPHPESHLLIRVYAKDFIRQVSPEVLDMAPSLLFESSDLAGLHKKIEAVTSQISPIVQEPFPNFNFANPSGHYFAVTGIS